MLKLSTYAKSIRPVITMVDGLFKRSMWSGLPVATHPPASNYEINDLLQVLRKISPGIGDQLKIDSSNVNKHPEIQNILDNHTRGSPYSRLFFK